MFVEVLSDPLRAWTICDHKVKRELYLLNWVRVTKGCESSAEQEHGAYNQENDQGYESVAHEILPNFSNLFTKWLFVVYYACGLCFVKICLNLCQFNPLEVVECSFGDCPINEYPELEQERHIHE